MHARWTLTVPLTLNDGTPVPERDTYWIESRILDIAGGFTATPGEGVWRSDDTGELSREPVTVYTFDVAHIADHAVRELARDIATVLDQEAVYVTRQDLSTQLVTGTPATVTAR